jgi:adenylate cyclase
MVYGFCLSRGHGLSKGREHERALKELETALQINPSFALARGIHAWALLRAGRFDFAVEEAERAIRLSPKDSYLSLYEFLYGFALFAKRQFSEAIPFIRRSTLAFPEFPGHYTLLISCCGHLGYLKEAKIALQHRNSLPGPKLTVSLNRQQVGDYAHGPTMAEGLVKAGVPDC